MTASAERASADNGRLDVPEAALVAARAADAKLGQNTVVLAMGEFLGVTDAFVITSGANTRQVRTIVEEVEHQVKESLGRSPRATEGLRDLTWVLMDYGDFLVHVFQDEARAYYDLERLWGDAPASVARTGPCSSRAPRTESAAAGARGPARRIASCWPPGRGRRSPWAPRTGWPIQLEGDAGDAGRGGRRGEHDLGHRLDLRGTDELAEGASQVHRGDPAGDGGPEDRRLGRDGALQARGRLGVVGPATSALSTVARSGARPTRCGPPRTRWPFGPMRKICTGTAIGDGPVVAVVVDCVGARRSKGMPWRDKAGGLLVDGHATTGQLRRRRRHTRAADRAATMTRHDRVRFGFASRSCGAPGRVADPLSVSGGELEDEAVLAVGAGLDPDPSAVEPHVLGHERQAEPGAVGHPPLARGLAPVEALEDPVALAGRHARAPVGHHEAHTVRRRRARPPAG